MKINFKSVVKNSWMIVPLSYFVKAFIFFIGEKNWLRLLHRIKMKRSLDLKEPCFLNDKIQWLKLNYYKPYYSECCDKYLIHDYIEKKTGKDIAVPVLFKCKDPEDFSLNKIDNYPFILKISNGCGSNLIVRTKDEYSDKYIRSWLKKQIKAANFHTLWTREHQYKEKEPYILAEKLLVDSKGGIPNDYKLLFINGELKFIYCSVDRLGINVRHIYSPEWKRLPFIWVKGANETIFNMYSDTEDISCPEHFDWMKEIGYVLAEDFPMVRIDFYETPEGPYLGEITLHHGSGFDSFYPPEFDKIYGQEFILPERNR